MSRIFINYRREDASANASQLYEWLAERYGDDQVFKDVDTIVPGRPWRQAIESGVGSSDLVLAVIGRGWLAELERRLADQDDFMRHELETALRFDKSIIPVLVEGATMPGKDELPESLAPLSEYQAFKLTGRFQFDRPELIKLIDRALGVEPELSQAPVPKTQPAPEAPEAPADLEAELKKWNWGAFLLGPIWGIGHTVYKSFLILVPFYGLYLWYLLGKDGNRWAWEKRRWDSVESFRETQRKWAKWGVIVDVVILFIIIGSSSSTSS